MVAAEHVLALVRQYGEAMRTAGLCVGDPKAEATARASAELLMTAIRNAVGCLEGH